MINVDKIVLRDFVPAGIEDLFCSIDGLWNNPTPHSYHMSKYGIGKEHGDTLDVISTVQRVSDECLRFDVFIPANYIKKKNPFAVHSNGGLCYFANNVNYFQSKKLPECKVAVEWAWNWRYGLDGMYVMRHDIKVSLTVPVVFFDCFDSMGNLLNECTTVEERRNSTLVKLFECGL